MSAENRREYTNFKRLQDRESVLIFNLKEIKMYKYFRERFAS